MATAVVAKADVVQILENIVDDIQSYVSIVSKLYI